MYAILTSKPGLYRTETDADIAVVETYDYLFYGHLRAVYQLVRLEHETRVRIIECDPPHCCNVVPTKFLEKFDSLEAARAQLQDLVRFGKLDAVLRRHDASGIAPH